MKTKISPWSCVEAALVIGIGGYLSLIVVPKFQNIFATMLKDETLPVLTQAVLAHAPWNILLISIALAAFVLIKDRLTWRPLHLGLANVLCGLVFVFGIGLVVVALFLPIIRIREGLSS